MTHDAICYGIPRHYRKITYTFTNTYLLTASVVVDIMPLKSLHGRKNSSPFLWNHPERKEVWNIIYPAKLNFNFGHQKILMSKKIN